MDATCLVAVLVLALLVLALVPWRKFDRRPVAGTTGPVTVEEWRLRLARRRATRGRVG